LRGSDKPVKHIKAHAENIDTQSQTIFEKTQKKRYKKMKKEKEKEKK